MTRKSLAERQDLVALVVQLQHAVGQLADAAQKRVTRDPASAKALESALVGLIDVTRAVADEADISIDALNDVRR